MLPRFVWLLTTKLPQNLLFNLYQYMKPWRGINEPQWKCSVLRRAQRVPKIKSNHRYISATKASNDVSNLLASTNGAASRGPSFQYKTKPRLKMWGQLFRHDRRSFADKLSMYVIRENFRNKVKQNMGSVWLRGMQNLSFWRLERPIHSRHGRTALTYLAYTKIDTS